MKTPTPDNPTPDPTEPTKPTEPTSPDPVPWHDPGPPVKKVGMPPGSPPPGIPVENPEQPRPDRD